MERKKKQDRKKATPTGNSPCLQVAFLLTLVCFYSQVPDTTTMSRLFRPVFVRPFDHNNPPSKRRLPPCSDTPIFRDAVCLLFASVFGVDFSRAALPNDSRGLSPSVLVFSHTFSAQPSGWPVGHLIPPTSQIPPDAARLLLSSTW